MRKGVPFLILFVASVLGAQTRSLTVLEKVMRLEQAVASDTTVTDFEVNLRDILEEAQVTGNINLIQRARTAIGAYQVLQNQRQRADDPKYFAQEWDRERQRQSLAARYAFLDFTGTVALGVFGAGLVGFSVSAVLSDRFYRNFLEAAPGSPEQQKAYGMLAISDSVAFGSAVGAVIGATVFLVLELLR